MERAEAFIVVNEMDDRLLFTLSAAALSSLTIDAAPVVRADAGSLASIVQMSAMDLIAAMFGRYPRHRSIIIEDMFPLMLQLPTSKRSLRTYPVKKGAATPSSGGVSAKKEHGASVGGDHDCIQPMCALTLLLIQSCVVMPIQCDEGVIEEGDADAYDEEDEEAEDKEEKLAAKANDTAGLEGCVAVCNQFTSQMLTRCSRKGGEGGASEFRPILSNLIDDLLVVRYLIEFPAAEMLLMRLSHRVSH
jgi:cohesin loading factor subunit SCC2